MINDILKQLDEGWRDELYTQELPEEDLDILIQEDEEDD